MNQKDDSQKNNSQASQEEGHKDDSPQQSNEKHGKNPLEWAVFGVSLLLVLATFGLLGVRALQFDSSPPRLHAQLGTPVNNGRVVMIPVNVFNHGGKTAEGVEVEVTHQKDTSNFVIATVPRKGKRQGWVTFPVPVEEKDLEVRVLGFEEAS